MQKIIFGILLGIVTTSILPSKIFFQKDIAYAKDINIDLKDTREAAERFLDLEKVKNYEEMIQMIYMPDNFDKANLQ